MVPARPAPNRRHNLRMLAITLAGVVVLGLLGIGSASADSHHWWWAHGNRPGTGGKAGRTPHPPVPSVSPSTSHGGGTPSAGPSVSPTPTGNPTAPAGRYAPPPANAGFDYQIGGAYSLPSGVSVVSRDHNAKPAAGAYNVCYVNAFQAQSEDSGWWQSNHNDLLLASPGRGYVSDQGWDEMLLDISTTAKRSALASIVDGWISGCASSGFQAVELDNLDSWTRSGGLLRQADAVAYAQSLVSYAHQKGLAAGQKNTLELGTSGKTTVGFDFAIAEECADYSECQGYVDVYGANVIVIEYDSANFNRACTQYGSKLSIVERDRNVTPPGSSSYVFKTC